MNRRDIRGAKKDVIEWAAFWEGNEMDFELKQLLHEEDDMVRIDLSKKIDEKWVSKLETFAISDIFKSIEELVKEVVLKV